MKIIIIVLAFTFTWIGCNTQQNHEDAKLTYDTLRPIVTTQPVKYDADDPAIWINKNNPEKSIILGTDKHQNGGLYAFDLHGSIIKVVDGLKTPNNVDVEYNFPYKGEVIDIAVVTERLEQRIRVYRLPELDPIDEGDLIVFNGDTKRAPMGIGIFHRLQDDSFFIMVSGKTGPKNGYIHQYRLFEREDGKLSISLSRQFGKFSGKKEIEAIAVDDENGFVYYSDETVGVRKYPADPDVIDANMELALFATNNFERDQEGISIYDSGEGKGFIIISDQQANKFHLYTRKGTDMHPHCHKLVKIISASTVGSDGNDVSSYPFSKKFPSGLFVAMSNDKTFHYYSFEDILKEELSKSIKFKLYDNLKPIDLNKETSLNFNNSLGLRSYIWRYN